MREHATFIVGAAAAIAVIIVVPEIWQGSHIAWAISAALFAAIAISIVMYIVKKRKQPNPPTRDDAKSAAASAIAVEVISAHDQSMVVGNEVQSTVNIYNGQPAVQSVPPENNVGSDGMSQGD
jgi:hypothetical protein